jgi:hypothetical protein
MRRHLTRPKIFDESSHVVGLVGTESDMVIGPAAVEQRERRLALGSAGCACDRGADGEAIAVLHQHVAHEGGSRDLPPRFIPKRQRIPEMEVRAPKRKIPGKRG